MKMYLDDLRDPVFTYDVIARSVTDAVNLMVIHGCPDFISFDHDLGDNEMSGHDLVKIMVETDLQWDGKWIPKDFSWYVHSANPVGRDNINGLLENYLNERNK